jgi:hypothetical protein
VGEIEENIFSYLNAKQSFLYMNSAGPRTWHRDF